MKKLLISLSIASSLGLSGCSDDQSLSSIQKESAENTVIPATRVLFNPSDGELSIPNDLLFSGTTDGTLNLPVADANDRADPTVALSSMDGWSTQQPFAIDFVLPPAVSSLDAASVSIPGAITIYQVVMGASQTDAECSQVQAGLACKFVKELNFGTDFVTTLSSPNQIAVVPITPFMPGATYIVAVSDKIMDSEGFAVQPASTYISVRKDITEFPLGTAAQLGLQAAVNSYESVLASGGVDVSSLIQTSAMTIQSAGNTLSTLKSLYAQKAAAAPQTLPVLAHTANTGASVRDVLVQGGVLSATTTPDCPTVAATLQAAATGTPVDAATLAALTSLVPMCASEYHMGSVSLPYYLTESSPENPTGATSQSWKAMCDSGAILAAMPAETLASLTPGPNNDACMALGLADYGLDTERNITKYNPVPQVTSLQTLSAQITLPNEAFLQSLGRNVTEPDAGWPVVVLMHGITSKKEDMLSIAGSLSASGFATVAIDMVLHGSRGFDINGSPESKEIQTTSANPLAFMNLKDLQVLRDNIQQSIVDLIGLRVGIATGSAALFDGHQIDASRVYATGHSLGAMWGIDFVALANTPLNAQVDGLFKINAASFSSPGGGIANFLLDSDTFGSFIQSNLVLSAVESFLAYATVNSVNLLDAEAYATARAAFLSAANLSNEDLIVFEGGEHYVKYLLAQSVDITNLNGSVFATHYKNFRTYLASISAVHDNALSSMINSFAFAVQTMVDNGDPNNYAATIAANQTPVLLTEIFGDGTSSSWDHVIPPTSSRSPLAGTEQFVRLMQLDVIDETQGDGSAAVSGFVRFSEGGHSSLLDPSASAAVTSELHKQIISFFTSDGKLISVDNANNVIVPAN
ncbi:VolA/Pla-1 family phospholipase [Algibacillus agarilyticus]|uniref:VolA/Pla-1 family phospholipase n=1 Tax=Algibacillus agarilyticus TaxID=2234133 RepID=UPI000DD06B17|nr:VolA/Pla-1 family phospholipase [Algibacillus agarilyticus]